MSVFGYRVLETTLTTGSGDIALEGPIGSAFRNFVQEVKAVTGIGTGPWSDVLYCVTDDVDFEIIRSNLEEGTGPGGKNLLKKSTGAILRSTNGGSAVIWGANTKNVFLLGPEVAELYALFGALSTAGLVKRNSATSFAIVPVSSFIETLLDDASASNARTTLSAMDRAMAEQSVLTTRGDLLVRGASAAVRLELGASGRVLRSDGTDALWAVIAAADASFSPTSPLTATTVQTALDQLTHPISLFSKSTSQANIGTSIVAVSDLANLTPPGSQSGKRYRVSGQVSLGSGFSNSGHDSVTIKVHVGTGGGTGDAVIGVAYLDANNVGAGLDKATVSIPPITFVSGASDRVTISVTTTQTNLDVLNGTGETFAIVEMVANA